MAAIIFDFDGVIVANSMSLFIDEAIKNILQFYPQISAQNLQQDRLRISSNVKLLLEEKYKVKYTQELDNKMREDYVKIISQIHLTPNIEKILEKCDNLAVASNANASKVLNSLQKLGLEKYFGVHNVFSSQDLEFLKPDPCVFIHAAKMMNSPIAETWIIEDSFENLAGAHNAGFKTFGYIGADHFLDKKQATLEMQKAGADLISDDLKAILEFIP